MVMALLVMALSFFPGQPHKRGAAKALGDGNMGLFGPCLRGVLRTHGPGDSYFETALGTSSQQGLLASVLQAAS